MGRMDPIQWMAETVQEKPRLCHVELRYDGAVKRKCSKLLGINMDGNNLIGPISFSCTCH